MGRVTVLLVAIGIQLSLLCLPGSITPAAAQARSASSFDTEVTDLVNAERAKAGLGALTYSGTLADSAENYAAYMARANFFAHIGPDGSTLVTRDQAAGYSGWTWLGENLAAGQATPSTVVAAWMASPGHRANILSSSARETGVGFVTGGSYGYYWAQEFGARSPAIVAPQPAPSRPVAPAPAFAPAPTAPNQTVPSRPSAPSSRGDRPSAELVSELASLTSPITGFTISGEWLAAYRSLGGLDTLGEPRSNPIPDPAIAGKLAQYFQRGVLEYNPENPAPYRIQRRLVGDLLDATNDPPVRPDDAPPGAYTYFPASPDHSSGLGHFVADYTRSIEATFFKEFFDEHGGVDAFGYPKEEPKLRNGVWTQRFQAAVFEYHPENDRAGLVPGTNVPFRNYRVQLMLLGDRYIDSLGGIESPRLGRDHLSLHLNKDATAV